MRVVRDFGEFLVRIGDAHRPNFFLGAQPRQSPVIKAGAIADPVPRAIERGQWHEQEIRRCLGRLGQRLFDCHLSLHGRLAGAPQPEHEGRAKPPCYRQSGFDPGAAKFFEKRQGRRLGIERKIGRNDPRAQPLDEGKAFGREMSGERGRRLGGGPFATRQSLGAQGQLGRCEGHGKPAGWTRNARGRDGRGISIPGTYNVGGRRVAKPTGEARDSSL